MMIDSEITGWIIHMYALILKESHILISNSQKVNVYNRKGFELGIYITYMRI